MGRGTYSFQNIPILTTTTKGGGATVSITGSISGSVPGKPYGGGVGVRIKF